MKRIKLLRALSLILALLLLSACGSIITINEEEAPLYPGPGEVWSPRLPTLEEALMMSDARFAETPLVNIQLVEEDGAFYLKPSRYKDWKPLIAEVFPSVKSPIEKPSIKGLPLWNPEYDEADIEEIALCLVRLFILDHMKQQPNTSFMIIAYKDLSVTVYSEDDVPEIYAENDETRNSNPETTLWYVVPSVSYRFVGEIEGVGRGEDLGENEWVTDLGGNGEVCLALMHNSGYSLSSTKPAAWV